MLIQSSRSDTWCGRSSMIPAAAKAARLPIERMLVKKPVIAAQMSQIPKSDVAVTRTMSSTLPFIRMAGEYTKRNGTMYELHPKRIAVQPVAIEGAWAIAAATYAAGATGGVMSDIMPKYRIKRCA